jgi:hypothetical protein
VPTVLSIDTSKPAVQIVGAPPCVNGVVPVNPYIVNCNLPPRGPRIRGQAPRCGRTHCLQRPSRMPQLLRELPGPNMGTVHTPRITSTALLSITGRGSSRRSCSVRGHQRAGNLVSWPASATIYPQSVRNREVIDAELQLLALRCDGRSASKVESRGATGRRTTRRAPGSARQLGPHCGGPTAMRRAEPAYIFCMSAGQTS